MPDGLEVTFEGMPQFNALTFALAACVAAAILLGNRFAPRWPLSLGAVIAQHGGGTGTALAWELQLLGTNAKK